MICVAISDKDYRKCLTLLQEVDMAEIRLDLTDFDNEIIGLVFTQDIPLIATCRPEKVGLNVQQTRLKKAIESGAKYVDIEIEAPEKQRKELIEYARKKDCKVIISYHNYEETPGMRELFAIADECYKLGADIAKIATMVNSSSDNARIMSLYSVEKPIVALGMGALGKVTRIAAPLFGAEFTFAADDSGKETAPGQIAYSSMKELFEKISNTMNG